MKSLGIIFSLSGLNSDAEIKITTIKKGAGINNLKTL